MPGAISELLTRRRLGGAALLLAGIAVAVVVLWPALRGDDEPAGAQSLPVRIVSVPELGLAFAHPRAWKSTVSRRVVRLRSPDGTAIMTFSSPVAGEEPQRVKSALRSSLTESLKGAKVVGDGRGRLGRRSVDTLEVVGGGRRGRVRALAVVEATKHRTYAITVLTPARPSRKRLAEVAQILSTVNFVEPVRRKKR